jgi:hypothetical protein
MTFGSSSLEGVVMANIIRDRDKLKALVHYVIAQCEDHNILGSIKLNKVLWLADLWTYVKSGQAITGEHYIKQQFGPVASTVGVVQELQAEGKIVVRRREVFGHEKTDYIALQEPENVSRQFTADEISVVDEAIRFVCLEHTAMGISDETHDVIWELAEIGEEIPYEAVWASRLGAVTKDDVRWAKSISDAADVIPA